MQQSQKSIGTSYRDKVLFSHKFAEKGLIIIFPQTGNKHAVTHIADAVHQLHQTR